MPGVDGRERLALAPEEVWRRLNDPAVLARCIPGCSGLERLEDGRYRTTLTVAVGAVRGSYAGTVAYRDVEAPDRCTIVVEGRGDKGSITGQGEIALAGTGDSTEVTYRGTFKLTGPVAGVAQRLAPGLSRRMIVETLRNLEREGSESAPPRPASPGPAASPAQPVQPSRVAPSPAAELRPFAVRRLAVPALCAAAGLIAVRVIGRAAR